MIFQSPSFSAPALVKWVVAGVMLFGAAGECAAADKGEAGVKAAEATLAVRERSFTVANRFLVLPIKNGAKSTEVMLEVEGKAVRRYGVELAARADDVDWYAFWTIDRYRGQSATLKAARATDEGFGLIRQADTVPGSEVWGSELLRPQFHFSQSVGWNNDPNGLVFLDGEWHLFFQHNPVGCNWGNMTWGHAVSRDLFHWQQLPDVLFPKTMAAGDCFSGGAIVDSRNIGGWKAGKHDVLVGFLTDTGAGEAVAYSNDRGRTFAWFTNNPVVRHKGRDPKVVWYEYDDNDRPLNERARQLGGHWVMAVYDEHPVHRQNIAFYTSVDLKQWQEQSHLSGYYECPELFELPVDRSRKHTRWAVFAADARYALGRFDGRTFTPEHEGKHQVHWGAYYAAQTFENAPGGRRVQIGWARIDLPGMPFNQTFSVPHELTLRATEEGVRLFAEPVQEINKLRRTKHAIPSRDMAAGTRIRLPVSGELFDIQATFAVGTARRVGLDIGGDRIAYDTAAARLNEAPLKPVNGTVTMRVLVDRPMLEIIGNDGRVVITAGRQQPGEIRGIEVFADGGPARLVAVRAYELKSAWKSR